MRLVMFDVDGTLIDSHAFITATMVAAFEAHGMTPPTPAQSRQVIGLSLPNALGVLSNREGNPLQALVETYQEIYRTNVGSGREHEDLYAGARDALTTLVKAPDTLLGVATGKAMRGVERVLALHDIGHMFVTRQTPDHNPSKPHPGMLLRAMQETGAAPANTVMIGDTTYDIEMAVAAGTRAIGVSWGYHDPDDLLRAGAHAVVDHYEDLVGAVDAQVKPDA